MQVEDKRILVKLQDYFTKLETEKEHVKKSFWPTDAEKPVFDLYHDWMGTPKTNPIEAEKLVMFSAAKMIELAIIEKLVEIGEAKKLDSQLRLEMEREGVPITGYLDGIDKNGNPIEIKSFYGDYQARELNEGKPKTSYLKQLAIYMDYLDVNEGTLLYMDRGTGSLYQFTLTRKGLKFKCNDIEFDLSEVYKRWSRLYKNNILKKIEPKSEFRYKIPVDKIDWTKISKGDISKARNNQKVIGDSWQVCYSPYKDLILEREGTTLGYTEEELNYINKITSGYTSKMWEPICKSN